MKLFIQISAFAAVIFLSLGCDSSRAVSEQDEIRMVPVELIEVERVTSYPIEERFVGVVETRRRSSLAFELAGTVEVVKFEEGHEVKKGEILASIDTSRLEARQKELRAALNQAEASRDLAGKVLERNEALLRKKAVSTQQFEEATEQLAVTEASVDRIAAQLESIRVDLHKSFLHAPYDGKVASRLVDEGAVVSPNEVVFEFLESGNMEVRVAVADEAARAIFVGDRMSVQLTEGKFHEMEVARVLPQLDPRTRTVDAILRVPEEIEVIRDGDFVEVFREDRVEMEGFFLPREALTESTRGLWAAFVAIPSESSKPNAFQLSRRDIEMLHQYEDYVFVRGAIKEKDLVLASGMHKVAPGQKVEAVSVQRTGFTPKLASETNGR